MSCMLDSSTARSIGNRSNRFPTPRRLLLLLIVLGVFVAACGGDSPLADPPVGSEPSEEAAPDDSSDGEDPPAEEPPATEVPTTQPPETEAPTEEAASPVDSTEPAAADEPSEDGDGIGLGLILLLLAVSIALLGYVLYRAMRGNRQATTIRERQEAVSSGSLLGNINWLHDQLSLELLSTPPDRALQRWQTERTHLDSIVIACKQQSAQLGGDLVWDDLAGAVSGLAQALDTAVTSRADISVDPIITREAIELVNQRRGRLSHLAARAVANDRGR